MTTEKTITAYKGFDKNWQCRGYQFEVGKTYVHDGDAKLCESGFHACESPLDTMKYYRLADGSKYAKVELSGVSNKRDDDTKRCGSKITVTVALTLPMLINAQVEWVLSKAGKKNTATGYCGHAAATGDSGHAAATGYCGCAFAGFNGEAKASATGSFAIAFFDNKLNRARIVVGTPGIDGIKADTFYKVDELGKLEECK